jgi:GNAT superfamily N-acetyltransferase
MVEQYPRAEITMSSRARCVEIGVPTGQLSSVVTSLEMHAMPTARTADESGAYQLVRHVKADLEWYRDLYRRVGTDWLWSWRLAMSEVELSHIIHDADVEVYALQVAGRAEGLLELDFRSDGECELKLFGVTPDLIGTGAGGWSMDQALAIAWSRPIRRFWVHTCTMDHPRALQFYIASGFNPFSRHIEIEDDPRLTGVLPRTAAPHMPLIEK